MVQKFLILFCFTVSVCAMEERERPSASLKDLCIQDKEDCYIPSLKNLCANHLAKKIIDSDYTIDESKISLDLQELIKEEIINEKGFWNLQDPLFIRDAHVKMSPDKLNYAVINRSYLIIYSYNQETQKFDSYHYPTDEEDTYISFSWSPDGNNFHIEKSQTGISLGFYNEKIKEWKFTKVRINELFDGNEIAWNPRGTLFAAKRGFPSASYKVYGCRYDQEANRIDSDLIGKHGSIHKYLWSPDGYYFMTIPGQKIHINYYDQEEKKWKIKQSLAVEDRFITRCKWMAQNHFTFIASLGEFDFENSKLYQGIFDQDQETWQIKCLPSEHNKSIKDVEWIDDKHFITTGHDGSVYRGVYNSITKEFDWQLMWEKSIESFDAYVRQSLNDLTLSPNKKYIGFLKGMDLYMGLFDKKPEKFDCLLLQLIRRFEKKKIEISNFGWSPCGNYFSVFNFSGNQYIWPLALLKQLSFNQIVKKAKRNWLTDSILEESYQGL